MPGRPSMIDTHPHRDAIREALLSRGLIRAIAARFCVSEDALYRYKQALGITPAATPITRAKTRHDQPITDIDPSPAEGEDHHVATAKRLQKQSNEIRLKALAVDDFKAALQAIRETRDSSRYEAELSGRLNSAPVTQNNTIVVMPNNLMPGTATGLPGAPAPQLEAAQPTTTIDADFVDLTPAEKTSL
jgi:hypothetical protein